MGKTQTELTSGAAKNSGQLKSEIEQTRAEMDRTVDALTEQLQLKHLLNDLLSRFKSGDGSSKLGSQAKDTAVSAGKWLAREIGRHPLPTAVIGAGVAWLIMEERRERTRAKEPQLEFEPEYRPEYQPQNISGESIMSESGFEKSKSPGLHEEMPAPSEFQAPYSGQESSRIEESKGKISETTSRARAKASQTAGKVSQWSRQKWEEISHRGERSRGEIGERTSEMRRGMRDRMGRARSQFDQGKHRAAELVQDYPLVVGVSAMVVGVLVGLSVPSTRRERRMMGPQAEKLKEQARGTAEQAMERGKEAVQAAGEAAREEAERQGLTPAGIAESAKEVARSAGSAAREEGQRASEPLPGSIGEQIRETVGDEFGREDEDDRVV